MLDLVKESDEVRDVRENVEKVSNSANAYTNDPETKTLQSSAVFLANAEHVEGNFREGCNKTSGRSYNQYDEEVSLTCISSSRNCSHDFSVQSEAGLIEISIFALLLCAQEISLSLYGDKVLQEFFSLLD